MCFYFTALTTLPSVRAIKMQFFEKCQSTCQKSATKNESSGCEKGKIIMNLSFNPLHYLASQPFLNNTKIVNFEPLIQENSIYKAVFISQYKNSIWQPPKIISSL